MLGFSSLTSRKISAQQYKSISSAFLEIKLAQKIFSGSGNNLFPPYTAVGYIQRSQEVLERFPEGTENLAIPTWFYGHEPSNLFASHIAKYFSNSIREDNLLSISLFGVVYAPGSAGTTQEIFQEAAQNHYATYGYYSPMVFLGRERYEIKTSLFPLLKQLAWGKEYFNMLCLTDEPEEVVQFIESHPPVQKGE